MLPVFVVTQPCLYRLHQRCPGGIYFYVNNQLARICPGYFHSINFKDPLSYVPSRDKNKSPSQTAVPKGHAKVRGSPRHFFMEKIPKY